LWVADYNLPLSIAESDSFQQMIQILDPKAKKISNKEMRWKMKDIHHKMKDYVNEEMKGCVLANKGLSMLE